MPRFELDGKFWEITRKAAAITTRFGKIGAKGQTRLKKCSSDSSALFTYNVEVTRKVKEGYVEASSKPGAKGKVAPPVPTPRTNPQLEKAIDADPTDHTAYSVYGDWLQGEGDPRGTLIALQLAGKRAAATKLIDNQADYFLGPLAPHQLCYDTDYVREKGSRKKPKLIRHQAFTWKYGFIHGLRLDHNHYGLEYTDPPIIFGSTLAKVFADLLAHPSGRFLTEITFRFNNDPNEDNLQDLIDVLAKKAPPTIRRLHFGDYNYAGGGQIGVYGNDTEISWYSIGNLGKLWKAVPGLRTLIIQGGSKTSALSGGLQLGTIDLPNLVHAEIRTGGLEKANAKAIATAKLPSIERLDVWYGQERYGGTATTKDVGVLLARNDLPKLRHLGIMNTRFSDELVGLLAGSPLVAKAKHLDFSMGTLTDDGATALAAHKAKLAHLDVLDVSHNYLTRAGIAALRGCAKKVIAEQQRQQNVYNGEIADRYPAIGE